MSNLDTTLDGEKLTIGEEYYYHDNEKLVSFTLGLSTHARMDFNRVSYFKINSATSITHLEKIYVYKHRENCAKDLREVLTREFEKKIKNL